MQDKDKKKKAAQPHTLTHRQLHLLPSIPASELLQHYLVPASRSKKPGLDNSHVRPLSRHMCRRFGATSSVYIYIYMHCMIYIYIYF